MKQKLSRLLDTDDNSKSCFKKKFFAMSDQDIAFNNTARNYPREKTVSILFEETVLKHGDKIAIRYKDAFLTYKQLNVKANLLASYLRECGVTLGTVVGLYLEPCLELIIGILAIVKAGGAYLPLAIEEPSNRLSILLRDANPIAMLTSGIADSTLSSIISDIPTKIIKVDAFFKETNESAIQNPVCINSATDLFCVLYTSGSTGNPKGCMISHRSVVNLLKNPNPVQLEHTDVVAQISNPAFDAMTFEIWGALLNGASLCIIPRFILLSASDFVGALRLYKISVMLVTTALFNLVLRNRPDAFDTLKFLLFGGEEANTEVVRALATRKHQYKLSSLTILNAYGPTECTTYAIAFVVDDVTAIKKNVPIGKPIFNAKAYILDQNLQQVSPNVVGELYLGGDGLALGYLNDPEKTAEKFIHSPWDTEQKIYRTGDLAYYSPTVGIVFAGRADRQFKIRGFRVELGEIESTIMKIPGIIQVVVVAEDGIEEGKTLVAYLVFEKNGILDFGAIYQKIKKSLPYYMMPRKMIQLEHIPLTANGKIDKTVLARLPGKDILKMDIHNMPNNHLETIITNIWQQILKITNIDVSRNLFDLGAHSLMLAEACAMLNTKLETYNGRAVSVVEMLSYPTIRDLAQHIEKEKSHTLKATTARGNDQRQAINRTKLMRDKLML